MKQILFFQGGQLSFHIVLQEDRQIPAILNMGHDLVEYVILVKIVNPNFNGMLRIRMQIEIIANISQDEVLLSVMIQISRKHHPPPTVELIQIGLDFFKMIFTEYKDARRHPVSNNDQFLLPISIDISPYCICYHSQVSQGPQAGFLHLLKMSLSIIDKYMTRWIQSILQRNASASYK